MRTVPDRPDRGRTLHAVAVAYTLFTVLVFGLWLVVGDTPWTTVVNLATFWWLAPSLLLLTAALFGRNGRAAAWLFVPSVLFVWSYGTAFTAAPPDVGHDLRIASFNTFVQAEGEQHVLDLVAAVEPDVLVLQEVFPPRQQQLELLLADTCPPPRRAEPGRRRRRGVVAPSDHRRPPRRRGVGRVAYDLRGHARRRWPAVQVVPAHLISPCPTCGPSILERLELEREVRRAEIGNVLDALEPGVATVVAGDLNSNERSVAYRRLTRAGFRDPQREVGDGMGFTWPADRRLPAFVRIDWILVRDLEPVAAWVGDAGASDHRPVIVDLAFDRED